MKGAMLDDIRHAGDLDLVERCLEGIETSVVSLQQKYAPMLHGFLRAAGASESETREILTSLWTDCVMGNGARRALLLHYRGQCPLIAWLKAVVMNGLIDQRRRAKRHETIDSNRSVLNGVVNLGAQTLARTTSEPHFSDAPLIEIMRDALSSALRKCSAEVMVMLQLVHINGLTQREVARMWGWTDSKISRALDAGMRRIADDTMCAVRRADAWLDLTWEDFVEFAANADWSHLVN
jgi:RNA polymerase sigma factor (sigma-70 family)